MTVVVLWAHEALIEDEWPNGISPGAEFDWAIYMELNQNLPPVQIDSARGATNEGPARLQSINWLSDVAMYALPSGLVVHVELFNRQPVDKDSEPQWPERDVVPLKVDQVVLYPALTHESEVVTYRVEVVSCQKIPGRFSRESSAYYRLVSKVQGSSPTTDTSAA